MEASLLNLMDVDSLVNKFIEENTLGIKTLHKIHFHNDDALSIRSLLSELTNELRTGCVTFLNKNFPIEEINSYLFYIVNSFCKAKVSNQIKKKTEYLCPGCLFLGKNNQIIIVNKIFKCNDCNSELLTVKDPKKVTFFRTFFKHNKNGYHCRDCNRFIPHPLDNSPIVFCPYFDCCFVGQWSSLCRMHHPTIQSNPEKLILDASYKDSIKTMKENIASKDLDVQSKLELEEKFKNDILLLREIIDYQNNNVHWSSSDFTIKHKCLTYQSFDNLLQKYPEDMVNYLLNNSRSGGFQHKVFQEYIRLLEESLPFTFKKNNKIYKIESLLDDNLCLFDGISSFNNIVNDKFIIKNNTQEFYIGGRKGTYSKPYYMGKLLNLVDKSNNKSLLDQVEEYTFSKIKVKDISPGTEVIVTHLRVPPHYQMGGMVYVNRVRKKIIDRAKYLLNKDKYE